MIGARPPTVAEMRNDCTFEEPIEIGDGAGGKSITWTEAAVAFGKLEPTGSPIEGETAGAVASGMFANLTVRDTPFSETIEPTWRVKIDGVVWNIRGKYPRAPMSGFRTFRLESGGVT